MCCFEQWNRCAYIGFTFVRSKKRGDEVITPPNSFIASAASIVHLGAIPVFCDVKFDQNMDPKQIVKKNFEKDKGNYASSPIRENM